MFSLILAFSALCDAYFTPPPYGSVLGQNNGVIGYSNGNASIISYEPNYIEGGSFNGTYSGMRWQCVEYSRRWLILKKGITFGDVDGASDIWNLVNFTYLANNSNFAFRRIDNGAKCPPVAGNVLIYAKGDPDSAIPFGHVAIITKSGDLSLEVAEQNWNNMRWFWDYSRLLKLTYRGGLYYLDDPDYPVLGWIQYPGTYSVCGGMKISANMIYAYLLFLLLVS